MVVHPFHPLAGQSFERVGFAHTWGEHRVFFKKPGDEQVYSLPARWTDVEGRDPVVVMGAGRSPFQVADLVALARLLAQVEEVTVR
ncbi:MAG: DUF5372 family protein [Acidimicrobiales bacterium]